MSENHAYGYLHVRSQRARSASGTAGSASDSETCGRRFEPRLQRATFCCTVAYFWLSSNCSKVTITLFAVRICHINIFTLAHVDHSYSFILTNGREQ